VRHVTLPADVRFRPRANIAAVVAGGVVGAVLRWTIGELMGTDALQWSTLLVNVAGSLILGWTAATLLGATRNGVPDQLPLVGLGAGFCGSFTTFSTFSVIVAEHIRAGSPGNAARYVLLTVALGIGAALIGRRIATSLPFAFGKASETNR